MSERKDRQAAINEATWRLQSKVETQKAALDAYKDGINDLIDKHAPNLSPERLEHLHPGWSGSIDIWCSKCSRRWPCSTINELRALYGNATGFEPATRPYLPLTIARPARPADRSTGTEGAS